MDLTCGSDYTDLIVKKAMYCDGLYQTAYCTPLLKAASQGAKDTIQMLLNAGCYIDVQDEHGNSAIHEASWNGFSQTAELLVKYNCNVCLMNKAGFTALHLAAQNGHNECSRVLLYAGCNPDIKNNYGDTALHTAARYGHAGIARILISARCKISEQNKNGDTALHIAAALKRRKIAKILVESGIETELANKQNETAVDVAKRKEYPDILLIITSYSKSKPPPCHQLSDEQVGVTFKEAVNPNIISEVYQENEPLHKHEPEVDKQQKERRFFFFKKNKKKATPIPVGGYKKPDTKHFCSGHEKPAVQGFFSHYVPQDGVQFYRDLAGNIKQGPIGYAPVCQCGPSLRRLENRITDTHQSLQKHITASHHLLSLQIDNLDSRTNQQSYASEVLIKDKLQNACNTRITECLQEERQESQAKFNEAHASMKEELEYWLNDRLASYGHCLDHHHDDSALPPQNLFFDFTGTGRLTRCKSDETLSASDYSGKFRKQDFYTSRQAAMQHIRSWDVAAFDSFSNFDRSRRKERNNNTIANSNKVVTRALVHTKESIQSIENDKNFITSSGNLTTHVSNTEKTGTMGRSGKLPWKQTIFKTTPEKDYISKGSSRVTFSEDQQKQHLEHHSLSSSHSQGSPHNPTDHINLSRQNVQSVTHITNPTSQNNMGHHTAPVSQHSYRTQQNLHEGGPRIIDIKLSELEDSRILTGQDNMYNNKNTRFVSGNQKLIHCEDKQDSRTLSADTLLNEESNMSYSRTITRSQSMENAIDRHSTITTAYNSGYLTDTALRQSSTGNSTQIIDNNQSMHSSVQKTSTSSCATYGYHLTETSISQNDSLFGFHGASSANSPQQGNNNSFRQASNLGQSPTHYSKFNKTVDPYKRSMVFPQFNHASREFIQPTSLHKSVDNLNNKNTDISESELSNSDKLNQVAYPEKYDFLSKSNRSFMSSEAHSVHLSSPKNNCLQHENLVNSGTRTSPAYALGNKEDSTCSSNQDSGYGSRNHGQGLKRCIDISGGTPSSSFSAEQSGCNTPSNADSPYIAYCELSNERMRTSTSNYRTAATTVYDNGFHFSPAVVPNKNIHSHSGGSRSYVSYAGSNYNKYNSECRDMSYVNSNFIVPSNGDLPLGDVIDCTRQGSNFYDKSPNVPPPLMSCKPVVHGLSNYNSCRYSYAVCDNNTHILAGKQLQVDAIQNIVKKSPSHRSGNSVDITEKLSCQQSAPDNHSFSFKGVTKPPKTLREQVDTPLLTWSSDASLLKQAQLDQSTVNNTYNNTSEGKANSKQQNSDSMSQVAIQALIQEWYQRKLMEAAHRLKQNHSYSQRNPEQYLLKNNTNCFQGKNVVNGIHDFNVHLSNSEKSQGARFQMFSPTTNFQTQNSYMCQFQNSTNKNSYTEHQKSDSLKNSGQSGVTQHADLHTRVLPLYERNFSCSSNASHLLPVDNTYHMKTEDSSAYTSGKQLVTYSSLFYDSVPGSDV